MRKAIFGFSLVVMCLFSVKVNAYSSHVTIEHPTSSGKIKILLEKDVDGANLEINGGYKIIDPNTGNKIAKGFINKQFLLRPTLDGVAWGEVYPGVFQVAICPQEKNSVMLLNGVQYAGKLFVYQMGDKISVVNELCIEDYVKASLNPAVDSRMDSEVLAALAIVERTNAYYHATKDNSAFWHLDAKEVNYQGSGVCLRDNGIDKAVELTHHLVMKNNKSRNIEGFFAALYTENSAGKTAPYQVVFKKDGNATAGVEAPIALAKKKQAHWTADLSMNELADHLGWDCVTHHEVLTDKVSGKVKTVRFYNEKELKEYTYPKLQKLLGSNVIKSSEFNLRFHDNAFTVDGYGAGSGVGLCLFSAIELAKKNHNAADILKQFFPQTKIVFMDTKK